MKKEIKNIKINAAEVVLLATLGITGITLFRNLDTSLKDDDIVTVAEEIESMKTETVKLDVELIKEIDEQIDEYETKEILNEQANIIADELLEELKEEKTYSGMNVSHEYEDYLKEKCMEYSNKYNVNYDELYKVVMTIGYRESDGKWDNNGVISYTKDYGEFQINECNLKDAKERFGYSKDDILNDKYKNADYFIDHICNIMNLKSCKSIEDIYGINNGWLNWKNKKLAVEYSKGCMEIMKNFFNNEEIKK